MLINNKFNDDDSLLCSLDRIFDDAILFRLSGQTHRGKNLETVALTTSRSKTDAFGLTI